MIDEPHAPRWQALLDLADAVPRCGAKRRDSGSCQSPAMPNGRCRMHGGSSPGAPKGEANGNYRRGRFTCEAIEQRRQLNAWIRTMAEIAQEVE